MAGPTVACETVRTQIDHEILPLIRALGSCDAENDRILQEGLFQLRRQIERCLDSIEHSLGTKQTKTLYRFLRSLRTSIRRFLDTLPMNGRPDPRVLEQAHVDLQLEPLTCPTVRENGINRIAQYFS